MHAALEYLRDFNLVSVAFRLLLQHWQEELWDMEEHKRGRMQGYGLIH